jgi:hypothetical protein
VLDNVFDPCAALRNMAAAVKPGGRLVQINAAFSNAFPYLTFTCGWFLDYFAANDFPKCQVYLAQFDTHEQHVCGPWLMWGCLPMSRRNLSAPAITGSSATVIVIAEKGASSTTHRNPVQGHYRSDRDNEFMDRRYDQLMSTSTSYHLAGVGDPDVGGVQRINQWDWVYCGQYGRLLANPPT